MDLLRGPYHEIGDVESVFAPLKIAKTTPQKRTDVVSVWLLRLCLLTATALAVPSPGHADARPTFDELLNRAQAQAASGHRWSPPGDNMTETISTMMDLISTATPKQLADLSALLESDPARSPASGSQPPLGHPVVSETSTMPTRDLATLGPAITSAPALAPQPVAPQSSAPKAVANRPVTTEPVAPEPVLPKSGPAKPAPVAALETAPPATPPAQVAIRPGARAAELFARGQEAERHGDVSGARRLYATAAGQGSATAARSLGRLYDPLYLKETAFGGIDPDPTLARQWYERAVAMGDAQATPLLQALAAR